ncbi:uncharacterized protein [Typha latifolia]|uniref:uncharacterized protein n=1 Tax=Typha latifolia TaxID=4733 RepID=UPI003C30728E
MGSGRDFVEISSDEEDFDLENPSGDSFDWLCDLLGPVGGGTEGGDDLMVVDELSTPLVVQKKNLDSVTPAKGGEQGNSDEDCQILESDPGNPVSVVDDKKDGGDDSGELAIVGEKGELACRDFPHPRHSCANFPFRTTSHEKHCNMCHCYVCDCRAPCTYWGDGASFDDHCHSTDKDGKWKALRQFFKDKKSFPISQPFRSSRPNVLRPCSATNRASPNTISQRQQQRPLLVSLHGHRIAQHSSKTHPLNLRAQSVQRERGVTGAFAAQLMYSRTRFKRVGTAQPGLMSLNANKSQFSVFNKGQMHQTAPGRSHYAQITPQRSRSAPVTLVESSLDGVHNNLPQGSKCPLVTSQRHQKQPVTSIGISTFGIQDSSQQKSQCAPVTTDKPQCPPTMPVDVSTSSWQDILASLEIELGVTGTYCRNITVPEQSSSASSRPSDCGQLSCQTNASQEMDFCGQSSTEEINLDALDLGCCWLNDSITPNIQVHGQVADSHGSTGQQLDLPTSGSNPDSGEVHPNSPPSSFQERVAEAAQDFGGSLAEL